jgi:hypothetical protein
MPFSVKIKGVYYAQRRVPDHLQAAVAHLRNTGRAKQVFLKQSLGTKDRKQADISIKPVLIEFDRILRTAEELEKSKPPLRTTLTPAQINRMAEYVYGKELAWDQRVRSGRDELKRMLLQAQKQAKRDGEDANELQPWWRYEELPAFGFSPGQLATVRAEVQEELRSMREQLALNNITAVQDQIADALETFGIALDPTSTAYQTLGAAVLRSYARALEDLDRRNAGYPVETPVVPMGADSAPSEAGGTLSAAASGWENARERPPGPLRAR